MKSKNQWTKAQSLIQQKLKMAARIAECLSPEFGRFIHNPLLRGQDISAIFRTSIGYVNKAWDIWQFSIARSVNTRRGKALFRAALIYAIDIIEDSLESENNSLKDIGSALAIKECLYDILSIADSFALIEAEKKEDDTGS